MRVRGGTDDSEWGRGPYLWVRAAGEKGEVLYGDPVGAESWLS